MTNQNKTSLTNFALIAATLAITHHPWQYWVLTSIAATGTTAVSWQTRHT